MDAVISPEPVALSSEQILRRAPMTVSSMTNNNLRIKLDDRKSPLRETSNDSLYCVRIKETILNRIFYHLKIN